MVTSGTYRIRNIQSGTILDLGKVEWVNVIGWEQNGRDNQLWYVECEGEMFLLRNCAAGNYVGVHNHRSGTKVHGCGCRFFWELTGSGNTYQIGIPGQNRAMELDQGHSANGTAVFIRDKNDKGCQKWYFEMIK
ncbi:unnamed protein product [Rhizoctonia solani]|uniref:Ricin B lectin domain-containing protein n=1 Tax=Rhizoctonia solani TaxID=456999 RepID=A0A8H3ACI3_9AGAM|nr:unnamed protein product [Rhizoctonia solani]